MADMNNASEIQHIRDAITDAATANHSTPLAGDYLDPTCFGSSKNILASSLTASESCYDCHQNDFVTHIQSLRHPGNQGIIDSSTGDITTSCPKGSAEYRAAYLSGIHPELCVYTPDGQYCQGSMMKYASTGDMKVEAGKQTQCYKLQGTGVTWANNKVDHLHSNACIHFNCGGYVSSGTEWSFCGATYRGTVTKADKTLDANVAKVICITSTATNGASQNWAVTCPETMNTGTGVGFCFASGYYANAHCGVVSLCNSKCVAAACMLSGVKAYNASNQLIEGTIAIRGGGVSYISAGSGSTAVTYGCPIATGTATGGVVRCSSTGTALTCYAACHLYGSAIISLPDGYYASKSVSILGPNRRTADSITMHSPTVGSKGYVTWNAGYYDGNSSTSVKPYAYSSLSNIDQAWVPTNLKYIDNNGVLCTGAALYEVKCSANTCLGYTSGIFIANTSGKARLGLFDSSFNNLDWTGIYNFQGCHFIYFCRWNNGNRVTELYIKDLSAGTDWSSAGCNWDSLYYACLCIDNSNSSVCYYALKIH